MHSDRPESHALRFAVRFEPDSPPEELMEFAQWVERLGYDELWFSEDLPFAGGIAMAATALACTERLRVGVGLLPAVTRNVATLAMEIAALARIAPGRVTMTLGHGVPAWMEQIGALRRRRLLALEETTVALRRLLAGEDVTIAGDAVDLRGVQLGFPPTVTPPILLGTTGPAGLELAGRSADGITLPELVTPAAIEWARGEMARGGDAPHTVMYALLSVDHDRAEALRQVRPRIRRILDFQVYPGIAEMVGLGADGSGEMTDEIVTSIAAAGTPDDCRRAVTNWHRAGAECVILNAGADDHRANVERFATEVLPAFRATAASAL